MRKLTVLPDKSRYSAAPGLSFAASDVKGAPSSRFGPRPRGAAAEVDCLWLCTGGEYAYLRAFHRTATAGGSLPFAVDLAIAGAPLEEYEATFVPGSFSLSGHSGDLYQVSAQLVASKVLTAADDAYDEVAAALLTDAPATLGLLDELANQDIPEALG